MNGPLEFRIVPKLGQVRFLRDDVRQALGRRGVVQKHADQMVLVVDEIVTNAIEHGRGYRQPNDELILRLQLNGWSVDVEFIDPSATPQVFAELVELLRQIQTSGRPPVQSERGRGLFLIHDGLEEFRIELLGDGTGLSMRGRLNHR